MSFNGSVSSEGPHEPDQLTVDLAKQLALNVRAQKTQSGQPRMSKSFDLPDGTQVYVLDYEHVWQLHIVVPTPSDFEVGPLPDFEFSAEPSVPIAGMLSGAAYTGRMGFEEISWPTDDPETGQKAFPQPVPVIFNHSFGLTPESAELFPRPQASYKLASEPHVTHGTLGDQYPRTQFQFIVPGKYTGAMSSIVQLLLGVGRIVRPDYEARWKAQQSETGGIFGTVSEVKDGQVVSKTDVTRVDSHYYDLSAQKPISYDYRWNRTHGVVWGNGNEGGKKPILVEAGHRGVHVMPFPVDRLSRYAEVQAYYKKVYPALEQYAPFKGGQETLFEAFGGFPTGENMPGDNEGLERWVRAGLVTKAENDLSEFYDGTWHMCTQFGWAFHPSQPRAINTGVRSEDGHKIGVCYQIDFRVQEKPEFQKVRNPLFEQVIFALNLTDAVDIFKARRLTELQALQLISSEDYDAFDAMEVESDWTVTAQLTLLREGIIDYPAFQCPRAPSHPCEPNYAPHFKYYEPMIGSVLNFNFENMEVGRDFKADGPIFATYTNRGSEILHYYWEDTVYVPESVNTRQHCQFTGSWREANYNSGTVLQGYFYSTSKDFREEFRPGGGTETTVTARVIGNADFISFCGFVAQQATLKRHYFGTQERDTAMWGNKWYATSASCASNNRSAFFICREWGESEKQTMQSFSGKHRIGDSGTTHQAHMYHPIWHWVGCFPWNCLDHGAPICRLRVCDTVVTNPNACMGLEPPSIPEYSVCDNESGTDTIVTASHPGLEAAGVLSAYYTNQPESPPAWSTGWSDPHWEYEWEVWGMGLDLMNNVKINEGTEVVTDPQARPFRASELEWWKCSIPDECAALPWPVLQNCYGKPFIKTYDDLDWGDTVQFGAEPGVAAGPTSVPFGVLE